jgi:ribosome biogenesis GTPase
MNLINLGYNNIKTIVESFEHLHSFELGRVIAEHKERYLVTTEVGTLEAEITGNMRYSAKGREDFPAVGDWVAMVQYDQDLAIINEILPRYSMIKRKAVNNKSEVQIIGTNIDYAFVIQSVNRDFNLNRLERYLTICYTSKISPIILLTKIDLISEEELIQICNQIKQRIENVLCIAISNVTKSGYEELTQVLKSESTYCMLGSSGVGKSTILNNLSGKSIMKTETISESTNKGRHVSTHRELTVLDNGSILIDNPGMREVGIADNSTGLETTYDKIADFAQKCRFHDCSHTTEKGCAVIEAVENGEIEKNYFENYLKLRKESDHFALSVQEKRKKDKDFGKMVKSFKKIKNRNKP